MDDAAVAVIQQAERVIYRASWRLLEEQTLEGLAGSRGLCWTPLEPRSEVIQLVTFDGEHLGHIRRDPSPGAAERWMAVQRGSGRPAGPYPSMREAATALAIACGKLRPQGQGSGGP